MVLGLVILFAGLEGAQAEALSKARQAVQAGKYEDAVGPLREIAARNPDSAVVQDLLGTSEFMVGNPVASCKAYDRQLKLQPEDGPGHWRRGISLYYAGRYAEGQKQFEDYQAVDGNDVENTVWKLMCQTRAPGQTLAKAQKEMLPIGLDRRVPMMKVLDLFGGKAKAGEVEALVAKTTDPERESAGFYGNLYLGLWDDLNGKPKEAAEYLEKASKAKAGSPYMRDVAKVHLKLLKEKKLPWEKPG